MLERDLFNNMIKVKYRDAEFVNLQEDNNKECIICLDEYKAEGFITQLKCNTKHYFHSPCIEEWVNKGNY